MAAFISLSLAGCNSNRNKSEEINNLRSDLNEAKQQIAQLQDDILELRGELIIKEQELENMIYDVRNKNAHKEIEEKMYGFQLEDLRTSKSSIPLLAKTYSEIIGEFGEPREIECYYKPIPASDSSNSFKLLVYEDIEFLFLMENEDFKNQNVFKFFIKSNKYKLVNEISCGMSLERLKGSFPQLEDITSNGEREYLKKKIMRNIEPDNYDQIIFLEGMVTEEEQQLYSLSTRAIGIVLLIKDSKVEGITNVYPTSN